MTSVAAVVLRQDLTEACFLSVFDGTTKLADIPLGSNKAKAREAADKLMGIMKGADGYADKTR